MRGVVAVLVVALSAGVCAAQDQVKKPVEPDVGQPGKDVVWVPTSQALVQKMLDLANVTAQDEVIDLGSGDGRTVIAAAKRGARARGIEYNPEMVELSIANAKAEGVSDKATFVKADLFETDLSKATVITMFLLTDINLRLRPTLLTLEAGHAPRLEHVHDGRMGSRRDGLRRGGLHELVHGAPLDRPGQGRRHVDAGRSVHADAAVRVSRWCRARSRRARGRRPSKADACVATKSVSRSARPNTPGA